MPRRRVAPQAPRAGRLVAALPTGEHAVLAAWTLPPPPPPFVRRLLLPDAAVAGVHDVLLPLGGVVPDVEVHDLLPLGVAGAQVCPQALGSLSKPHCLNLTL